MFLLPPQSTDFRKAPSPIAAANSTIAPITSLCWLLITPSVLGPQKHPQPYSSRVSSDVSRALNEVSSGYLEDDGTTFDEKNRRWRRLSTVALAVEACIAEEGVLERQREPRDDGRVFALTSVAFREINWLEESLGIRGDVDETVKISHGEGGVPRHRGTESRGKTASGYQRAFGVWYRLHSIYAWQPHAYLPTAC